ncbi:hypothetical protein [Actinomadura miaoliensis]|uniref:GGDEF domain-containing protein n=1 Tax=Actinomadura miaoliensis TaxID=430685 RepID=A0ABP7WUM2_9ACTN
MLELDRAGTSLLDVLFPKRTAPKPVGGRYIGLPDGRALHRVLASGRAGHWALVTVHVVELARLDDEHAVKVLRLLVGRLDEILNDDATVYQTGGGLAVLAGPGDDRYQMRHGTLLLRKAVIRKLTEPDLSCAGVPPLTLTFEASTGELSRLRAGGGARRRSGNV